MFNYHKTAAKLRDICKDKGVTAKQIAQICGSNRNIFNYIDHGKIFDVRIYVDIAQFLGVGIEEIIQIDEIEI